MLLSACKSVHALQMSQMLQWAARASRVLVLPHRSMLGHRVGAEGYLARAGNSQIDVLDRLATV